MTAGGFISRRELHKTAMSLSPPQPLRARASSIVQPLTIDSLRRTTGLATPPASPFSSVFTRPPRQHLPSPALSRTPSPPPRETHAPVLRLAAGFALSAVPIVMALSTLPVALRMPRTLADIALLGRDLKAYAASAPGMAHVMAVMCCLAVWEHAWSIPGSVVLNVLAGALVSPLWATLLMTLLTSLGSLAASLLAAPLEPIVQRIAPKALDVVASALQGDPRAAKRTPTWVRIVVMRLVGVVPWSAINIACGVCRVPFVDCAIGAFIGALPWTAVTCQVCRVSSHRPADHARLETFCRPSLLARPRTPRPSRRSSRRPPSSSSSSSSRSSPSVPSSAATSSQTPSLQPTKRPPLPPPQCGRSGTGAAAPTASPDQRAPSAQWKRSSMKSSIHDIFIPHD